MSNVSIVKNSFFQRVFSSRAIDVDDKQKILNNLCKKGSIEDSIKFFEEFNKLMKSKDKTSEKNNLIQENIRILITSCGYDVGITASITVAIIYHLSKITKSTKLDIAFITENLNKYLNLTKNNVNQIIKYINQMEKNIYSKYTSNIYINESIVLGKYAIEYPEELQPKEKYFEYNEYTGELEYLLNDKNESNNLEYNNVYNFKYDNMIKSMKLVKNDLRTGESTKDLTWKENKQKATLAIYNYINKKLKPFSIDYKKDNLIEIKKKTAEIEKINKTLEVVLEGLQELFNRGGIESLPEFDNLNESIKSQINKKIYNDLTGNSDESKKLSENLLKNLRIIVTHKNTDGIFNNSKTKTRWFANSSNKYNIRTDTHEKIRQAIINNKDYEQLPIIKGLIDKAGMYSGKTSTYYYKPHWYSIFDKSYEVRNGFGILKLGSEFNHVIVKAKWKNGVAISGEVKGVGSILQSETYTFKGEKNLKEILAEIKKSSKKLTHSIEEESSKSIEELKDNASKIAIQNEFIEKDSNFNIVEPTVHLEPFGLKNFKNDCFINSAIQFILNNEILLNAVLNHPDKEIKNNFKEMLSSRGEKNISKQLIDRIRHIAHIQPSVQDSASLVLETLFNSYKFILSKPVDIKGDLKYDIFENLNANKKNIDLLKDALKKIPFIMKDGTPISTEYDNLKSFVSNNKQLGSFKELFDYKNLGECKETINLYLLQKLLHHEEFQQKINGSQFLWFDSSNYGSTSNKDGGVVLGTPLKWSEISNNESVNSIVVHLGNSINSGHYYAYIKKNNQWYKCNDSNISKISDIEKETKNKRIEAFSYEHKKYETIENDIFKYEGEVNEKGEMYGRGKIFWKDTQHTYMGEFKNDCPCGSGVLYKNNNTFNVIYKMTGDKKSEVSEEVRIL